MRILSLFTAVVMFNASSLLSSPASEGWQTDYSAALAQGAKGNKSWCCSTLPDPTGVSGA